MVAGGIHLFQIYGDASAATDIVVPYNPHLQWALSDFNVARDFVVSYSPNLPFEDIGSRPNRLTKGWTLSGDTRFSTGFPVTLMENDDNSLLGVETADGMILDVPSYSPGRILSQTHPRKGWTYFNTSLFSAENRATGGMQSAASLVGQVWTIGIWRSRKYTIRRLGCS